MEKLFEPVKDKMLFIAENGGVCFEKGECVYSLPMPDEAVLEIVRCAEELYSEGVRILLSGEKSAYVTHSDREFAESCNIYCARLETVSSFDEFVGRDRIIKIALFDMNAEGLTYPAMKRFSEDYNVILSNTHWVDIVHKDVNKGCAVRKLMDRLGAGFDEAMVFGDYLNDLEMMGCCKYSYAMENAHPILKENAAYNAPSNDDNGVVKSIISRIPEIG